MTSQIKTTNEDFILSLKNRGYKTTRTGSKEANFLDYGNALGSNVQKLVLDSFGKEGTAEGNADRALQATLASGWANNNFKDAGDIKKYCQDHGIKMSVKYVNTQHIVDNKKGGKYANNKTDASGGGIAVYTFSQVDPKTGKSAEIKIADANGNGGLETEELFMNEFLTGITSDIAASAEGPSNTKSVKTSNPLGPQGKQPEKSENSFEQLNSQKGTEEKNKDTKSEISIDKFESMVKDLMSTKGWSENTAKDYVGMYYNVRGLEDSQSYKIKLDEAA